MEIVKVVLGGQEYEVVTLSIKASRVWREQLGAPVQQLMGVLTEADSLRLDSPADVVRILDVVRANLLGAPDFIFAAVCAYCPAIKRDREAIEETATDAELMDAFVEVLKLAFPFGRLASVIRRSPSG